MKNLFPASVALSTLLVCLIVSTSHAQEADAFKPSGKVWGCLFGDYYFKVKSDTAADDWTSRAEFSGRPENHSAFTIRRAYLGYDYQISPAFSASFLLEGNEGSNSIGGKRGVYIKSAFLEWKNLVPHSSLLIGQSATPTWNFTEKFWFRSLEKTITDMRGYGRSNDLGIALKGSLDSAGVINYWFMLANGTAESPENNRTKNAYADVNLALLNKKLFVELYYEYEDPAKAGPLETSKQSVKALLAVDIKPLTAGAEVIYVQQNAFKPDTTGITPLGVSVFARGTLIKDRLAAFARYDLHNADLNYRDRDTLSSFSSSNMYKHYDEQLIIAGLDYTPHKNVHIMPNIWVNTYAVKKETAVQKPRDPDVVARVTFYYVFK